uniref:Uncharacterized protein n=1 Tax=Haptolina ericina TaxID=156174 RepID=A0A6T8ZR72_9EUKA|mmetsp:Transcript_12791/g.29175  ORF Transcript_12791/g.29175 Transcript_12791/m.29175 type:complete len:307 (+) Transcript_12791:38-958(+)
MPSVASTIAARRLERMREKGGQGQADIRSSDNSSWSDSSKSQNEPELPSETGGGGQCVIVGVNKRIEGHRPSSSPPMVRIVRGNPGRVVRVVNVRVSSEDGQRALEELKAELEGTSDVESVAMYEDGGRREGLIMAGYRTGVLRVWGFNPANHAEWEEIAEGMWVEEVARAAPEKHWRNTITGERVRRRPSTGALKLKAELRDAHSGRIDSIDFSPDGMRVVSGSDDGTIRLWDSGGGRPNRHMSGRAAHSPSQPPYHHRLLPIAATASRPPHPHHRIPTSTSDAAAAQREGEGAQPSDLLRRFLT